MNVRSRLRDERGMLKSERIPALLSVVAAGLGAWLLLSLRGSEPSAPAPTPTVSATTLRHVNASGAYSFDYPMDWVATDAGASSQVSAPDRSIVMTFAPGARADLDRSSDALVEAVRSEYRDVEILARDRSDVGGSPGRMVSGLATNRSGLRIRFLAITVMESARTYSILVFTDARADPGAVLPPTQAIVASFGTTSS
jgi:hypothetical protein